MSVAAIVIPISRRGFVNEQKFVTSLVASTIGLNCLVELHESIQELRYNDDSVTDDMLILVSQNLKKTKGCVWGITTRMIKLMKFHTRSKIEGWQCN